MLKHFKTARIMCISISGASFSSWTILVFTSHNNLYSISYWAFQLSSSSDWNKQY